MESKKCSKCGKVKDVGEFYNKKSRKDGKSSHCKCCSSESVMKWRKNNPEKVYESELKWRKSNPEKVKKSKLKWDRTNKEKKKCTYEKWRKSNIEKLNEKNTIWRKNNPGKVIDYDFYYIQLLKDSGFTTEQINENPELIEIKKLIIKTKRLCKTLQTSEKV